MNLAVNARDAMPKGGTLVVSTRVTELTAEQAEEGGPHGRVVALRVADDGCGMTEEVRRHVFEPFFTTKEKGKGTGLGLSTVYGIVRQSGGSVRLESEPGKGTVFTLYFPLAAPAAAEPEKKAASAPAANYSGAGKKVLLVEDEEQLRRLSARTLREAGYTVFAVASAEAALAELERVGKVDALVTDLVMPGMNGAELAREVTRRGLAPRVLYMSGYSDDVLPQTGGTGGEEHFIHKPFSVESLLARVGELF
jgi:CheY-like chemotaxis protein